MIVLPLLLCVLGSADAKSPKQTPVASGCPWAGKEKPHVDSSTMTTLKVNAVLYDVHLKENREKFTDILKLCEADDAVDPYTKWRAMRRNVNISAVTAPITAIGGLALMALDPYSWIGPMFIGVGVAEIPTFAVLAGTLKQKTIDAIEDSTPPEY